MRRNIKSLSVMVIFLLALTACDNSGNTIASQTNTTTPINTVDPTDPAEPIEPLTPSSRSGAWPDSALNDPELVGKEPVMPEICQTLTAELTQNALGLLDETVDANPERSQPDTIRIQAAINACSSGAVKLVVGNSGENAFLSGPLTLKSDVMLWVDQGITLFASRSPADYQVAGKNNCGETASSDNGCNALITGTDVLNSGVVGEGIIDGRGGAIMTSGKYANTLTWWDVGALTKTVSGANQNNPRLIQVTNKNSAKPTSQNFTLYKITLQNAPKFHFVPSGVNGVTVWGVKVLTPSLAYTVPGYDCPPGSKPTTSGSPNYTRASTCFTPDTTKNTDAIDPGQSQNVLIAYNHISTGDDGVAIKSHNSSACVPPIADKYAGQLPIYTVSNVKILHNRLYFTHGMSIGSETDCGIKDVEIRDLTIDGHDADFAVGVRIKTDMSVGGEVKNVSYDGVCIRRAQEALTIDTYYSKKIGQAYPDIQGITIKNYHYVDTPGSIYNGENVRVTLRGFSSDGQALPLRNIVLDNTVFDSSPLLASKGSETIPAAPSYAQITMGPGPVSIANLLLSAVADGAPEFEVWDDRDAPETNAEVPYDCSNAFALFPSEASAL
ncbi:glycoside hydrolase family 28 protein [Serratia sp. UGAL515B_01]|uniref:glycoside hydrolase family 28 protein n=1 Tax=Serratia sp. UGAL515B_01 TaxID=2986763 RepID=UPI002955105F|nr:glycosyl hydrolase family 28 protein [Serratia sp. UGAL515B_01]WON77375.1 glycosyl hydrolase family 28 protein [Serratia sp. UGAL515B_01]